MRITLNKNQAYILQHALDIYCRVGTKQLEMIVAEMDDEYLSLRPEVEDEVRNIKKKLFNMDLHAGKGISGTGKQYRESYSMMKIIQKYLYDKDGKGKTSVWSNGNILELNSEPEIEVVD